MIGRINGTIVEKRLDQVLVDVNGLAYEVEIPLTTYDVLGEVDDRVSLRTHFIVREDAQILYGFGSERERELFRSLIKVNGVGPRVALGIQSSMDPESFVRCVRESDVKALVTLPGIGKKTAERLIIDMRDRLPDWELEDAQPAEVNVENQDALADAESALIGLGYRPQEAALALAQVKDPAAEVGGLIRQALKWMSDQKGAR
jgi:holliday junction DNA helicase RuvA